MTTKIDLHNGEQILLVGVPDGSIHWSKLQGNKDIIKWALIKVNSENLLNFYSDMGIIYNVPLNKANESCRILGTWIPRTDSIDFEIHPYWVDHDYTIADGASWVNYLVNHPSGKKYCEFETKEQSFLSLLKSHTKDSEAEKFLILKINSH